MGAGQGIEECSFPEGNKDTKGHIGSINLIRGNMGSMLWGWRPFAAFIVAPIMHQPLKYSRNREAVTKRRCPLLHHTCLGGSTVYSNALSRTLTMTHEHG